MIHSLFFFLRPSFVTSRKLARSATTIFVCGVMLIWIGWLYAAPVTLNLKNTDINALIQTVSQITGKNFIVDPRVRGNVNLISSKPMEEEEVYQVFLSILSVNNFAAIPAGNAIKIVPAQLAKQEAIPTLDDLDDMTGDQRITRVIPVKNVAAAQIVPIVRPLIPPEGHLAAYIPTNVLIVSDASSNVERITQIIERIDQASDESIEVIVLKHASAIQLSQTISQINTGEKRDSQTGNAGYIGVLTPNSSARIIPDERSNSVLLSGSPQARENLKVLIAKLDQPVKNTNTQVIYLQYAKAEELLPILQGNLQINKQQNQNDVNNPEQSFIQADPAMNAIILNANPMKISQIRGIIQQLDVRRAQVMVEAVIAEVSYEKAKSLGVQWAAGGNAIYGLLSFTNAGLPATTVAAIAGANDPTVAASSLLSGEPVGGILIGSDSNNSKIGALIQALNNDVETNILSTPSLVTLDNEEAEIIVGQNVPFITGSYTQTTESSTNPFQTIERQDVGINLKIRPQINRGNAVKLEISQEVSALIESTVSNSSGPVTNKRAVKTNVIVGDGEILVLGGLIDDQTRENLQRVPGLSNIPLLGHLFKSRSSKGEKRNLMIFIRPVILRTNSVANRETQRKYNFIQDQQHEAQAQSQSLLTEQPKAVLPRFEEAKQQGFGRTTPETGLNPAAPTDRKKSRVHSWERPHGK